MLAQRTHLRQLPPKDCGYRSAGSGSGELCALCDLPIEKTDVEYVVEWAHSDSVGRCRFHLVCYHLWNDQ
jgi:hypothetical protein